MSRLSTCYILGNDFRPERETTMAVSKKLSILSGLAQAPGLFSQNLSGMEAGFTRGPGPLLAPI